MPDRARKIETRWRVARHESGVNVVALDDVRCAGMDFAAAKRDLGDWLGARAVEDFLSTLPTDPEIDAEAKGETL